MTGEREDRCEGRLDLAEPCFYRVLQINANATPDEIRRSYRRLARQFHPDRRRLEANPQAMDIMPDGLSDHDMFSLIARAYEVLIDPTNRATYDMLNGHRKQMSYTQIGEMRRQDAVQAVDLMKVSFDLKRRAELAKGGLVIDDAIYGPQDLIESKKLEDLVLCNQVVNVTRQLQCAVENSKLILPANEPKYSVLQGVYDPCECEEKLLCVRYYFRGKLHRVVVGDTQRLIMPVRSHLVGGNGGPNLEKPALQKPAHRVPISTLQNLGLFSFVCLGSFYFISSSPRGQSFLRSASATLLASMQSLLSSPTLGGLARAALVK